MRPLWLQLLYLTFIRNLFGYSFTGNELTDFETTNLSTEVAPWSNPPITNCNGTFLIGGYGVFGIGASTTRTYNSLPPHNMIYMSITVWRIDSWDAVDSAMIYVDGRLFQFYSPTFSSASINICGATFRDHGRFDTIIHAVHNASNLTLRLQNGCNQGPTDESIGFRDIRILFMNVSEPLQEKIWATNTNALPNGINRPSCIAHFYYNSTALNCAICDDACLNCTQSSNRNCTGCNPIGYYNASSLCLACDSTCYSCIDGSIYNCTNCSVGNYLFPNNQCLPNCPIAIDSGPVIRCNFPCKIGEYLYPNGSCASDNCTLGFIATNFSSSGAVCVFECVNKYRYDNGSCIDRCEHPFYNFTIYGKNYCRFKCNLDQYYYANGSCFSSCTLPWRADNISVSSTCNFPCPNNQYFYQNSSCLPKCEWPFSYKNITLGVYCDFPCSANEFFYINNTCLANCNYPFSIINTTVGYICDFPCQIDEYYYQNYTCNSVCKDPFLSLNISVGGYCNFKCKNNQYLFLDDTCTNNCSSPYIPIIYYNNTYCIFPCPKRQYLHSQDDSCRNLCKAPKVIVPTKFPDFNLCVSKNETNSPLLQDLSTLLRTVLIVTMGTTTSLLPFGFDPFTAIAVLIVMQNFYFTLFYNVVYPDIVKMILGNFGVTIFSFIPNPIDWFIDPVPDLPSPENFYVNNYTGFFFFTAFQTFVMIGFVLGCYFYGLLAKFLQRPRLIVRIGRILLVNMKKSFIIRFALSIYSQLLLSALLQILVIDFSRPATIVSYFFSILTLVLCVGLPIFAYQILGSKNVTFKKLKEFEVFIEDYDINEKEVRLFGMYVILKRLIHGSALVLLYYIPILQCLIPSIANLVMIVLMLRLKPHHRMGLNAMDFINEIGMFGLHCSVLVLAYYDTLRIGDWDQREICGYIILMSILIVFLASMIFVWRENFLIIKKIALNLMSYLKNRKQKRKNIERFSEAPRLKKKFLRKKAIVA